MSYYAMQPMPMMSGMAGGLTDILKAPITRWNQSSAIHKIIAAGTGAGLAYYLHQKGMADAAVAVAGVAGAYAASMALHYPTMAQQTAMAASQTTPALPAPMNSAQQPTSGMIASSTAPTASSAAGSKWSLLG